jgi:hypothetical protein
VIQRLGRPGSRVAIPASFLTMAALAGPAAAPITIDISPEPGDHGPAAAPSLTLTLSSPSSAPVTVKGLAHVELSGSTGDYWAPFDLITTRSVGPNMTSTLVLKPVAGHTMSLHLSELRWARRLSALWPNQPLDSVPKGRYSARVVIDMASRQCLSSKPVEVTIASQR